MKNCTKYCVDGTGAETGTDILQSRNWNQNQNPLIVNSEYLKFDNAPLAFVLETLKYSNDMQFTVSQSNLNQPRFTGTLTFKQNADQIAALLSAALNIEIKPTK